MPAWLAFALLAAGQFIIFLVMRALMRKVVLDEPSRFLPLVVGTTGVIAVLFAAASVYLYLVAP